MPAFFDEISTLSSLCCHHPFASESNHLWPYLQKGDDIIVMVMLEFRQNLVDDEVVKSFKPRKGYLYHEIKTNQKL